MSVLYKQLFSNISKIIIHQISHQNLHFLIENQWSPMNFITS